MKRDSLRSVAFGAVAVTAAFLFFGIVSAHFSGETQAGERDSMNPETCPMSGMSMMECMNMDVEDMDNDGDGACDFCGMSIEGCESMMGTGSAGNSHRAGCPMMGGM